MLTREEVGFSGEPSSLAVLDFISAVKELHGQTPQELGRLIREAESNIILLSTKTGPGVEISVDRLVRYLALHLISTVRCWRGDVALFRYLLSGMQLLNSLCSLAPRHSKIEKIFADNTKVSEQIVDLIVYMLAYLATFRQDLHVSHPAVHLHSALVASSLYLLIACTSSKWNELTQALLLHKKVDVFVDVVFAAVRMDIKFLHDGLSTGTAGISPNSHPNGEEILNYLSQQCEASLQFLQSCCQQKCFQEHLVKNEELCGKGGIILLVQTALDLNVSSVFVSSSATLASTISRIKSKGLSILLHLCEAESVSYLDEVASNPETLGLAKSVALEVLDLLKTMFAGSTEQTTVGSSKRYPKGQLQLNGLRLADIFSDDSNFRSFMTDYFTQVLTTVFYLPHEEFLSTWCSSELPVWEEDASLEYNPCTAAAWALSFTLSSKQLSPSNIAPLVTPSHVPRESYAHQRTSLLVKVIANLHCFVPEICKEEKDQFLRKFLQCLQKDAPESSDLTSAIAKAEKAAIVNRNLNSLLRYAKALIPSFLNEDDVQLLRVFISQVEENQFQEAFSKGEIPFCRKPEQGRKPEQVRRPELVRKPVQVICESNALNDIDTPVKQKERTETASSEDRHPRKRKRQIMGDEQIVQIEIALKDEPDMHRNAISLITWSEKLSALGSEVTPAQLKNWLNNRKARMSRIQRVMSEVDTPDKPGASGTPPSYDLPSSSLVDVNIAPAPKGNQLSGIGDAVLRPSSIESLMIAPEVERSESVSCEPGQHIMLLDQFGKEIGKGVVHQVRGYWGGMNMRESRVYVVDVHDLRVDRFSNLPYPSQLNGTSFDEAEKAFGKMRVLWDASKLARLQGL